MAGDANDSQAITGDITKYRALVTRISLSQDRPDLKFASIQVCYAMASPSVLTWSEQRRFWEILRWENREQSAELDAYSDADWCGDRITRRSVSAGAIMTGGHCLNVWTMQQQVVSLSTAERELYAAVKTASEGLGILSLAKDLEVVCGLNLHLDASATLCLVSHWGLGKAKYVNVQHLWIQEASKSEKFVAKTVGTHVNPAHLMTKHCRDRKLSSL